VSSGQAVFVAGRNSLTQTLLWWCKSSHGGVE
jgi:hypothetical protein